MATLKRTMALFQWGIQWKSYAKFTLLIFMIRISHCAQNLLSFMKTMHTEMRSCVTYEISTVKTAVEHHEKLLLNGAFNTYRLRHTHRWCLCNENTEVLHRDEKGFFFPFNGTSCLTFLLRTYCQWSHQTEFSSPLSSLPSRSLWYKPELQRDNIEFCLSGNWAPVNK